MPLENLTPEQMISGNCCVTHKVLIPGYLHLLLEAAAIRHIEWKFGQILSNEMMVSIEGAATLS